MSTMDEMTRCTTTGCKEQVYFVGDARCQKCQTAAAHPTVAKPVWSAQGSTVRRDEEPVGTMSSPSTAMRVAKAMNDSEHDLSGMLEGEHEDDD